jgi:hypothetical protein
LLHADMFAHNKNGIAYREWNPRPDTDLCHAGVLSVPLRLRSPVLLADVLYVNPRLANRVPDSLAAKAAWEQLFLGW